VGDYWPVLLQFVGVIAMAIGFGLLAIWLGIVVGGLGLLTAGVVAEVTHEPGPVRAARAVLEEREP